VGRIIVGPTGKACHIGGRLVPKEAHRLHLGDKRLGFDISKFPATPARTNYSDAPAAQACLRDILLNDQLGCCTEADQFHRQALRQAAGGQPVYHPTSDDVRAVYTRDGGLPGDNGCDEVTVLTNACQLGIPNGQENPAKPLGYLRIDATDMAQVRCLVTAFVGANVCAGLPDPWVQNMPSGDGFVWDVAGDANDNNGHSFTIGDQDGDDGVVIWSWGMRGRMTKAALAKYGTVYVVLDQDIIDSVKKTAPDGLAWDVIQAAFNVCGGVVPPPAVPAPVVSEESFWQRVWDEVKRLA